MVCGRLDQRSWEDKEGQKRSRVEIVVEDFNFMSNGGKASSGSDAGGSMSGAQDVAPTDISDDPIDLSDIPF